jgi:hypothetical protein
MYMYSMLWDGVPVWSSPQLALEQCPGQCHAKCLRPLTCPVSRAPVMSASDHLPIHT